MKKTIVFFLAITGIISSCSREPKQPINTFHEGPIVAVINGDSISTEFFQQAYIQHILNSGKNDTREERYSFLNSLTDDVLLAQQAEKFEVLDSSYTDYMNQVKRLSIADRYYSSSFLDTLSLPSEEQIQTAFFNTKVKLHVSHLFFTDKQKAELAYQRLEDGESFLDLANEIYNTQQYDSTAGYIGEISYFNVDDAFGEAAYELKSGEYSDPVRTRKGYHIIYVNNRIGNPLVTTAEFQYKKDGIEGLTKERIKTLKGDAFVRSYMQSLGVKVDRDAVEQLYRVIGELEPRANRGNSPAGISQEVKSFPTTSEVNFIRKEIEPATPLASYQHFGEERIFTAGDYFNWVKTIPLQEARNRTMASVGRALRNQVFYEAGSKQDLSSDPIVEYNMDYKSTFYRSYLVKEYLRNQPVPDIPLKEQKAAFSGMDMNESTSRTFSGWVITATSLNNARSIKQQIEEGEKKPSEFNHFENYHNEDIRKAYALQSQIMRAPLNTPVVAAAKDAFYVLFVAERHTERVEFEEVQDEVIDRMSDYYNIVNTVSRLRKVSEIEVDTSAFERLMDHLDDPALKGRRK